MGNIEINKRYVFNYPDYYKNDSDNEYTKHSGAVVTVIALRSSDKHGPIYKVLAEDGWTGLVYEDELSAL